MSTKFIQIAILLVLWGFRGFVIQTLWGWFVTPQFNLPAPSIQVCLGLSFLGAMLTGTPGLTRDLSDDPWENIGVSIGTNLFFLGAGWLTQLFT